MTVTTAGISIDVKNILVTTDFSPASDHALAYAQVLALQLHAHLHVVHVLRPESWEFASAEMVAPLDQLRRAAIEQLDLVDLLLANQPHSILLGQGSLWSVLDRTIREHQIDLIVAGSGGGSGLEHLLLGSSAEEISRRAHCPVLIAGPAVPPPSRHDFDLQRIVLATDLGASRPAAWAVALARQYQAQLTVLYVVPEDHSFPPGAARSSSSIEAAMRQLVPVDDSLELPPEFVIEHGDAAQKILALCHQRQADLVVLGCHPAGRFAAHVSRAIAHQVLARSRCPVLTVH